MRHSTAQNSTGQNAGVDIAKDTLDVCLHPSGAAKRFTNDGNGHRALITWLAPSEIVRIVFEATGAYHCAFERTLAMAGLPVAKINPRQARRFAEATGKLAKTDRCDAAMLARFGALLEPAARPVSSETIDEMKEFTCRPARARERPHRSVQSGKTLALRFAQAPGHSTA